MKAFFGLAVLLAVFSPHSADAQVQGDTTRSDALQEVQEIIQRSGVVPALDSLALRSAPELEEALGSLATTLSALAERIANDRELRASALRAAEGVVTVAQHVVAEQSDVLLEALRTAAERISEIPVPEGGTSRNR